MIDPPPASVPPIDPATWRESVLSTRSLSYLSQADLINSPLNSRHPSLAHLYQPPTRRSTLDSTSDYGLEMAPTGTTAQHIDTVPELPESVAHSLLFTLPREIRDRIWTFCLTTPASTLLDWPPQTLPSDTQPHPANRPTPNLAPELLRTCRLISTEALPLLYTHAPLTFSHPSDANIFTHSISSPIYAPLLQTLHLTLRPTDTRLWLPYLTSASPIRSLRSDFPSLRHLIITYKSTKWQPAAPLETNLRHWAEDSRLDELITSLNETYLPNTRAQRADIRDELARQTGLAPAKLQNSLRFANSDAWPAAPRIRVLVTVRVSTSHFATLTNPAANPPPPPPAFLHNTSHLLGGPILPNNTAGVERPLAEAVVEGETFRGFSGVDFVGRGRMVVGEGKVGQVARSVWVRRGGVELGLEVGCS